MGDLACRPSPRNAGRTPGPTTWCCRGTKPAGLPACRDRLTADDRQPSTARSTGCACIWRSPKSAAECFPPLFKRQIDVGNLRPCAGEAVAHLNHLHAIGAGAPRAAGRRRVDLLRLARDTAARQGDRAGAECGMALATRTPSRDRRRNGHGRQPAQARRHGHQRAEKTFSGLLRWADEPFAIVVCIVIVLFLAISQMIRLLCASAAALCACRCALRVWRGKRSGPQKRPCSSRPTHRAARDRDSSMTMVNNAMGRGAFGT